MEKLVCNRCKKVIEGYNSNHVGYLMKQHNLAKHEKQTEFERTK